MDVVDIAADVTVQETLEFIRQVVSGRCDHLDLQAIRDAINRCLGADEEELAKWQGALEEVDRFLATVPGMKEGDSRIEQLQSFMERIAKAKAILESD